MRIMFDLSGTVFGSLDYTLRPGIKETIGLLRIEGHTVEFWTSGRKDNYKALLEKNGIPGNVYSKGEPLPFSLDICVDDKPESWMPGKVVKVKTHVGEEMPGGVIDAVSIIAGEDIDEVLNSAL